MEIHFLKQKVQAKPILQLEYIINSFHERIQV
jgi:hypothetical protein